MATHNLLLIEDSPSDARLLQQRLEDAFYGAVQVEHEGTLATGLARLTAGGIDAVLVDLGLPDSSGVATVERVLAERSHAAVVVMTALADTRLAEEAVSAGAQDYLLKDESTPEDLSRAINYAIRRQRVLDDLDEARQAQLDAKDTFLSHVSHELRTPLAAIHQFVSLLADEIAGPLTAEQHDLLGVAARNVKQLTCMIDDLLAVGRLRRNTVPVDSVPTDLCQVITDCVAGFERVARDKSIRICFSLRQLPTALCDPWRTRDVLNNLLDNAIKFTPDGGDVLIEARRDDDRLRVTVTDSGLGIRPENRERVFDQFFQERAPDDPGRGGLGLGLYIAKQTIERQGGRIRVDDADDVGTRISFTVPVDIDSKGDKT